MQLTNNEIYIFATAYNEVFADFKGYIPAKANFIIQKNFRKLVAQADSINEARTAIIKQYGIPNGETGYYNIPEENQEVAYKELQDLLNIEQEIDIKKIKIEDLGNTEFTSAQMQVLMFMIEED